MKAYCLASSSAGNCYIFEFKINNTTSTIMVECGIQYKEILRKCNEYGINLSSVQACLITHAHKDHCWSAKNLARLNIPIYAHKDTLEMINVKGHELTPNEPNSVLNGLYVIPFEVDHDIDGALGFMFRTKDETIMFVNDCKTWKVSLKDFKPNTIFIECNYDNKVVYAQYHDVKKQLNNYLELSCDEIVQLRKKLKQHERNINAHMSLYGTIRNLKKVDLTNCSAIMLMHLSDRYANEYKMKTEVMKSTRVKTYVCGKKGGIK